MSEYDPIIEALEQSARRFDSDAGSVPTPEFRARCRARVIKAAGKGHLTVRLPVSRRFATVALATCLSLLLVIPALAGPGGVSGTMSTVATGMRHMFGPPSSPDGLMSENAEFFGTPGVTPTHPDNHGADVSAVAKATPQPGENHGEQVRDVARDNHGHNKSTPTATSGTETATETSTSESVTATSTSDTATATETSGTETPTETSSAATGTSTSGNSNASSQNSQNSQNTDNHGSDVSSAAQQTPETSHGQDVSSAAQSTPEAGENHGQQVKDVATDNHGHDVSSVAHGTSTPAPEAAPETTPETTPEAAPVTTPGGANNHSHGGGKGHGGD